MVGAGYGLRRRCIGLAAEPVHCRFDHHGVSRYHGCWLADTRNVAVWDDRLLPPWFSQRQTLIWTGWGSRQSFPTELQLCNTSARWMTSLSLRYLRSRRRVIDCDSPNRSLYLHAKRLNCQKPYCVATSVTVVASGWAAYRACLARPMRRSNRYFLVSVREVRESLESLRVGDCNTGKTPGGRRDQAG